MPEKVRCRSGVQTELLTLETVFEGGYSFSIPSYQRPYVWSDDDVLLLFNDIKEACKLGEPNYFIGTTLSSELGKEGDKVYELIDGQQRTTTLMLMAIAFKRAGVTSALSDLAGHNKQPRLQFTIRDQVQQLLGSLAGLDHYQKPSNEEINKNEYLKQIGIALNVLSEAIKKLHEVDPTSDEPSVDKLANYLYSSVHWVNNIVPPGIDLNRLFATMNTSGVQLEQADILKAKLFKNIKNDKAQYDAMWVACEHLENYFERNVRKVFAGADWNKVEPTDLATFNLELFGYKGGSNDKSKSRNKGFSIDQLALSLRREQAPENTTSEPFETYDLEVETVYCRSIISFPLLLIHAYRVYLALNNKKDIEPRLHSDRLLEIFEPLICADEESVTDFIEMLWQVRYQFDRWVVKWVERDDSTESQLSLTKQSKSPSGGQYYINRTPKELNELVLLQSVRNFTGERSAQYWITPFLARLIATKCSSERKALKILERIDNRMSLASSSQKSASFSQARHKKPQMTAWGEQALYFSQSKGTSFEHYWFQKLEYLLWKQLKQAELNLNGEQLKKFKRYRITSKNSVEHIHPQNNSKLDSEYLHHFGNLVLLSPGENSSYSDKPESVKRAEFMKKDRYDSLKSKFIFEQMGDGGDWTKDKIESHFAEVLSIFDEHYSDKE